MHYRRNADTRLRELERIYQADPGYATLMAYNRERRRHGELPIVAPIEYLKNMNLGPTFWGDPLDGTQFPGGVLKKHPFDDTPAAGSYPITPKQQDCERFEAELQKVVPLLIDLGWIALIQQCGNVHLKIKKNEYGEYEVQWIENGRKNEEKTNYASDKQDAEATMREMQRHIPKMQYPVLYTVPRTVLEPSGDPIVLPAAQQHFKLVADQWMRYEDPRTLTEPSLRRGSYPVKMILVERPLEPAPKMRRKSRKKEVDPDLLRFGTWHYTIPYDGPHVGIPYISSGNHGLTREASRLTYIVKLLKLSTACQYQLFEK